MLWVADLLLYFMKPLKVGVITNYYVCLPVFHGFLPFQHYAGVQLLILSRSNPILSGSIMISYFVWNPNMMSAVKEVPMSTANDLKLN